jgi:predicted Zn-dependent peptidase
VPNNAVLSIAGAIDVEKTKALVKGYFEEIPKGAPVAPVAITELPLTHQITDTAYDSNIQIPAIFAAYRIPGNKTRDSKVLEMISSILSGGGSSRLSKKMVDEKKNALQVSAFNYALEDYGAYITLALPNNNASLDTLLADIDAEVASLQTDLISESEYKKILNQFENSYVSANSKMLGVAENLADGYTYTRNTNQVNEELEEIRSITREEIRETARKYLVKDHRLVLYYLPGK